MDYESPYVINARNSPYRLWKKGAPLLTSLDMELTERCNNNCIHCSINLPRDDLEAQKKELSTKDVKNILSEAASLGCLKVRFTGGEPLLRDDFDEIYLFARRLGLRVSIFTNGTLISERLAELFSRFPPKQKIEVSIYGMKKGSYEAVTRSRGTYKSAFMGINRLQEKGIPFIVKSVLLPPNSSDIESFKAWASRIPLMDHTPPYAVLLSLRCRRDSEEKNYYINKLRLLPEKLVSIMEDQEDYFEEMKVFCSKFMGPSGNNLFTCGAGLGSGCVDAYGNFQLCMWLRHPETVYDLKTGSLRNALENFVPKIRHIKAKNPVYLNRCAKCFLKGFCRSCIAKSWVEYGTLDTPVEYFCQIGHSMAEHLGLLKKSEKAWKIKNWKKRLKVFAEK